MRVFVRLAVLGVFVGIEIFIICHTNIRYGVTHSYEFYGLEMSFPAMIGLTSFIMFISVLVNNFIDDRIWPIFDSRKDREILEDIFE